MKRLLGGAATVGAGVASGQVLVLLVSPLLSRLFSPDQFGVYAVAVAIAAVISIAFIGRLDLAVPVATSDRSARDVMMLGLLYLACGTLATAGFIGIALITGAEWLSGGAELLLIPGIAFFAGLSELASAYLVRRRMYVPAGTRSVLMNGSMAASQLSLGYLGIAGGLTVGHLLSRLIAAWYALRAGGVRLISAWRGLRRSGLGKVARHTARFPLLLAPSSVLNAAGSQAPVLLLGVLAGPFAAGLFAFSQRILGAPVALLSQSLAQVFAAESASALRADRHGLRKMFLRSSLLLAAVAALAGTTIFTVSPLIFEPLFGEEWRQTGQIAQALSFGVAAQIFAVPVSQTLIVLGRDRTQFAWDLGRLTGSVVSIVTPLLAGWNIVAVALIFSVASATAYLVLWGLCFRAVWSGPKPSAGGDPGRDGLAGSFSPA